MSATANVTQNQWRIFFASIEKADSIATACRKSNIPRSTFYYFKRSDRVIAERYQEALEAGTDYLKDAATERAVDGVESVHEQFHRGELVARHIETKYSDRLLLALLASRDPSFRQTSSDQVQQRLVQELTRMLDVLQRKLPPEIYEMVVDAIATSDDNIIDVSTIGTQTPFGITSGEEDTTRISE